MLNLVHDTSVPVHKIWQNEVCQLGYLANPTNISGQKLTGVASFMLLLGLDYVKSNVNVMLMVAELNY